MFASFLALLERYPAAWSFVGPALLTLAWVVVSSIFCSVYDKFSPHSDADWTAAFVTHPRWAAVVSVMKTGGINVPGLLRALRVFFGGPVPAPLAGAMGGTRPPSARELREAALEAARAALEEQQKREIEKYAAPLVGVTPEEVTPVDRKDPR